MDISLPMESIKQWSFKGGLGILDQLFFSGANFVFNIFLARWLLPTEYGIFAISFAILLIFYQLHSSVLLDPMSILGPVKHAHNLYTYFWAQVRLHFFVTALFGVIIVLGSLFYHQFFDTNSRVADVLMIMGLVLPLQLLPWLLRRIFYILQKPGIAALGSSVYALINIAGLYFLRWTSTLLSSTAIMLLGVAGLLGSIVMAFWLKGARIESKRITMLTLFKENWFIAGWLVASAGLVVVAGQAQVFISGSLLGLREAGAVRVLQLFIQPAILILNALAALMLPVLASDFGQGNIQALKKRVNTLIVRLLAISIPYEIILLLFAMNIEHFLYQGKFSAYAGLIPIWGLIPIILSINLGHSFSLQAVQRPYALLIVSVFWVFTSVCLGVWFTTLWGVWGVTLSTLAGYVVNLCCFAFLYYRWVR